MDFEDLFGDLSGSPEDYLAPAAGVVAAAAAALLAPPVRRLVRRGAVWGMAGVLAAADAVGALGHRAGASAEPAAGADFARELAAEARAERARGTPPGGEPDE